MVLLWADVWTVLDPVNGVFAVFECVAAVWAVLDCTAAAAQSVSDSDAAVWSVAGGQMHISWYAHMMSHAGKMTKDGGQLGRVSMVTGDRMMSISSSSPPHAKPVWLPVPPH